MIWISSDSFAKQQDPSNNSERGGRNRKGFLEMASDKLSEMSGAGSKSHKSVLSSGRQTRSSTSGLDKLSQRQSGPMNYRRNTDSTHVGLKGKSGRPSNQRALGDVKHDKGSHRYILDLGSNQTARIDYKPIGKNLIELCHTEVPEDLRGRGIGKSLAKGALESASKSNLKLKVTCEYLQDYMRRFADEKYRGLLLK